MHQTDEIGTADLLLLAYATVGRRVLSLMTLIAALAYE
jgi:hypothetical protein